MTLLELAERCEAAMGPDRELDASIHCAIKGWQFSHFGGEFFGTTLDGERFTVGLPERAPSDTAMTYHKMRTDSLAHRYTASLDAAMTLVPEGYWLADLQECGIARDRAWAKVDNEEAVFEGGAATTPALAICAASLRARAASADRNPQGEKPQALSAKHESAVGATSGETPGVSDDG